MLTDILAVIVISASFAIGQFLYAHTQEELDWLKHKFQSETLTKAKHFALVPIGLLGLLQAIATKTQKFAVISVIMLIVGLLFGSLVIAEKDKKLAKTYVAETVVTFLVFFAVLYLILNLELIS